MYRFFQENPLHLPKYVGINRDENGKPISKQQAKKLKKQKKERAKTIAVLVMAGLVLIVFAVIFAMAVNGGNDGESSVPDSAVTSEVTSALQTTTTQQPEESSAPTEETIEIPTADANISLPDFTERKYENTVSRYEGIFTFIPTYVYTDEYPDGAMYDQSVEAGTMVAPGIQIEVKVSKGPSLVKLPEYDGLSVDKYVAELNELNIKYSITQESTNDVPAGTIVKCSKEPGDLVNVQNGEAVTVYVAVAAPEQTTPETAEPTESGTESGTESTPEENTESTPAEGGVPVE